MTTSDPPPAPTSVNETVSYGVDALLYRHIPFALFLGLLGLTILAFPAGDELSHRLAVWLLIGISITWIVYALYRRSVPGRGMITLSPAHVLFRIPMVKEIRIPWREIAAVETIDVSLLGPGLARAPFFSARGVTALRIPRAFYDRHIHVNSAFLRGPGWGNTFIVGEKEAKVALHHEIVGVPAGELRQAVEARWRAFGPPDAVAAAGSTKPASSPLPRRTGTVAPASRGIITLPGVWRTAKIAVLLIGIAAMLANIAGLWQTSGQATDRKEKAEWEAQFRQWEEEDRRSAEEKRKRDKEWEEFWRKNRF